MDEVAASNPALRQAVSETWAEMDGTGGAGSGDPGVSGPPVPYPPPPTAPRAPGFVNGYFKTCNVETSIHQNYWQPVFGATSYDVYFRVIPGGTNYVYSFTTSATSEETFNTVDVRVKVRACNPAGCSWLSADDYVRLDQC
jgi:hypothetical protein